MVIKHLMRIICYLKAIMNLIRLGICTPHCYETTTEPAIIIATESSFQVSDNLLHASNETVYPNAILEQGIVCIVAKRN